MTVNVDIGGIQYPYPNSAADQNWAAQQLAVIQALAANGGSSGGGSSAISAATFGFLPTATGVQNQAAWVLAIAAARADNVPLFIPDGTYDCNGHSLAPIYGGAGVGASLVFPGSVEVFGAGPGKTILAISGWIEPTYSDPVTIIDQNDNAAALMVVQPVDGIEVKLSNLTLKGPAEADLTHALSNVWGIYSGGGGSLELNNVFFENFNQSIKFSNNFPAFPGTGTRFSMIGGYDQFRGLGFLHEGDSDSEDFHDELKCRHRYQSDLAALISQLPTISAACHCLYISNGVSLRTIQNTYEETGGSGGESGCAWRHYSVGDSGVPKYSQSIGDVFLSGCAAAIIPNPNFVSTILGPTIHTADRTGNTAIQCPGPVIIDGLHMIGVGGASFGISDGAFTSGRVELSNSLIEGDWVYAFSRINDAADRWKIGPNVEMRCTSTGGGAAVRTLGGGIDFDGVLFDVTGGGTGASAFLKGGSVRMGNTRFTAGCKKLVIAADTAALSVEFQPGVIWDDSTRPAITPAAFIVTLSGQTDWYQGLGFQLTAPPSSQLVGSLQARPGIGTYAKSGASPNIALALPSNADTYVIDEAASPTIDNINMAGQAGGGAVANDLNCAYQPTVQLYVKQAFALGGTGNIVASGGLRPVGSVITLTYVNTLGTPKWVEVTQNLILAKNITTVGSGADTTEDNLMTYSLPAATLGANAQGIRVTAWGDGANTADVTTIKGYFGATAVVTKVLTASQANTWWAEFEVFRTGATAQTASGTIQNGGTANSAAQTNAAPGETLSGAVTVKFTGQRATSSVANSLRQLGMTVELLP